jgi:hypothetical protein
MDRGGVAAARREASGRVVVDCVDRLATCLVPGASSTDHEALVEYSMNILGSLVGAGLRLGPVSTTGASGMGAFWAVGDRIERRLRTQRRDDGDLARFKLLRAELSTFQSLSKKT